MQIWIEKKWCFNIHSVNMNKSLHSWSAVDMPDSLTTLLWWYSNKSIDTINLKQINRSVVKSKHWYSGVHLYLKWSAVNLFKFKRNITALRLRIEITVTVGYFVATSKSWSYANICMWCIAWRGERGRTGRREANPTQKYTDTP